MGPLSLGCVLLTCLPATGGSASTPPHTNHLSLSPDVQVLDELGGSGTAAYLYNAYSFIAVDTANAANLFAAHGLQAALRNTTHLRLALVPLRSVFSTKGAIVIGALDDPNVTTLLGPGGRNLTAKVPTDARAARLFSAEGYVLDIRDGGVVLAGASEAGTFFGCQTLAQIINITVSATGLVGHGDVSAQLTPMRVTDWPSWGIRGMHVHELNPKMAIGGKLADNFHTQVDRMAAHKMNFFSAMTTSDIPFDIARNGQWELEMQAYCADRHMTYVPSINLGQTLSDVDGRTGEGIWAKDVPAHVSESGEIVPDNPPFLPLRNGAFEEGPATGAPVGWRVVGGGGSKNGTWTLDGTQSATSGGRSMRLDAPAGVGLSARLLSDPVPAEPGRTYQLSFFAQVSNTTHFGSVDAAWVWLVQLDKSGAEIQGGEHLPTGVQLATNHYQNAHAWLEGTCTFVAEPLAAAFRVYAGQTAGTGGGYVNPSKASTGFTWWLDDVAILALDFAFSNHIHTTITDFVLRPVGMARNDSFVFKAGTDYTVTPATVNISRMGRPGEFRSATNHSAIEPTQVSKLRATSSGKLQTGTKLVIDYDFQPGSMGFHTYDLWRGLRGHFPYPPGEQSAVLAISASRSRRARLGVGLSSPHTDFGSGYQSGDLFDPLYFDIAIDSAVKLLDFFAKYGRPVEYINLDYDELQTIARDSRTLFTSGMTNGELVASSINKIVAGIRKAGHTKVRPVFWDDMLNPMHLHGRTSDQDNLQAQHYGREDGTLDTAMELVEDKSIIWLNWFYDWPFSNYRLNQSLPMEWGLGFDTIGCPNDDFRNIQCYGETLSKNPEKGLGFMDTDWDGTYKGLIRTAEVSWRFVHNDTLECNEICLPHPCVPPGPPPVMH